VGVRVMVGLKVIVGERVIVGVGLGEVGVLWLQATGKIPINNTGIKNKKTKLNR